MAGRDLDLGKKLSLALPYGFKQEMGERKEAPWPGAKPWDVVCETREEGLWEPPLLMGRLFLNQPIDLKM